MPLWLQTVLTVVGLLAVVPLFVLANTSRPASAWYALKRYLLCLAIMAAPFGLVTLGYLILSP